jgi:Uma2 family endonuclease
VNTDAGVSHEPDAAFVSWESFEAGRAHAIPREGFKGQFMEIEGSPDWHMEIVSEGSVTKDKRQLPESYHKAGVREYWLIDARGADIQFQILINTPTGYQPAETKDGWQFSVVFQRWFKLERTRGKLDRWRYSLLVREQV